MNTNQDQHPIDHLFREQASDLHIQPSTATWDELSTRLSKKKQRQLWRRYSTAAVFLLISGFAMMSYFTEGGSTYEVESISASTANASYNTALMKWIAYAD